MLAKGSTAAAIEAGSHGAGEAHGFQDVSGSSAAVQRVSGTCDLAGGHHAPLKPLFQQAVVQRAKRPV